MTGAIAVGEAANLVEPFSGKGIGIRPADSQNDEQELRQGMPPGNFHGGAAVDEEGDWEDNVRNDCQ